MKPGDTFGDYKVIRRLGKGGMGEVWLLEGNSGRQVAAKILETSADHESRKRFLREAHLALGVKPVRKQDVTIRLRGFAEE